MNNYKGLNPERTGALRTNPSSAATSCSYIFPADGALDSLSFSNLGLERPSLFAGHVGNMDGSTGSGVSLKYSDFSASSADMRRSGSYVNNLEKKQTKLPTYSKYHLTQFKYLTYWLVRILCCLNNFRNDFAACCKGNLENWGFLQAGGS